MEVVLKKLMLELKVYDGIKLLQSVQQMVDSEQLAIIMAVLERQYRQNVYGQSHRKYLVTVVDKPKPCPDCAGSGKISLDKGPFDSMICQSCHGTGVAND